MRDVARLREAGEVGGDVGEGEGGQHEEQSVEEGAPRHGQHGQPEVVHAADDQRVDSPRRRAGEGEQVAGGVELQAVAVEHDEADARHRHGEAQKKPSPERRGVPEEQALEQGGEEWHRGDDDAHVARLREGEGDVLQQVVEADAAQPRRREGELLPPRRAAQPAGVQQPEGRQPHEKAGEEDLHRREIFQQGLGGDVGHAPHAGREKGDGVSRGGFTVHGGLLPVPCRGRFRSWRVAFGRPAFRFRPAREPVPCSSRPAVLPRGRGGVETG